ncbi:MAG: transcriptional regulator, partial [Actinomycetota bacterium]
GRYFDLIDVSEAVAHEFAAAFLADRDSVAAGEVPILRSLTGDPAVAHAMPLRAMIGNPADPGRRPLLTAVTTLTLRADRAAGTADMILHWRDPAKVASGGGLYQPAPAGMFQPSHDAMWNRVNDFNLWRAITRELSEELLGGDEDYHSDTKPFDYASWPFYAALTKARRSGLANVYWLGLGLDPLTLAADQLTVLVVDAEVFDQLFAGLVKENAEGRIIAGSDQAGTAAGIPFTAENIEHYTTREPMQAAGAGLLRTAWQHRDLLLS